MSEAPGQTGIDLSSPDALPADELGRTDFGVQEFAHRSEMQRNVIKWALRLSIALYLFAMLAFLLVLYTNPRLELHVSTLLIGFFVPPTVIMLVTIKAAHSDKPKEPAAADNLPALNLLKEIAIAVREAIKAVK